MEGPSLVILKEVIYHFRGKKVLAAKGYAKINIDLLTGKTIKDIKTWGKYLLLCFPKFTVSVHFGLFGTYRLNDHKKGSNAAMQLLFTNGEINFYITSIKIITQPLDEVFDWSLDALSANWNARKVKKRLLSEDHNAQIGDLLLKPSLFPAVGNIIRNEVLYRSKVHPESKLHSIPGSALAKIINETKKNSKDFLKWKKSDSLSKHWEIYTRKTCPNQHTIHKKYTGKTKRRSFICKCLKLYK